MVEVHCSGGDDRKGNCDRESAAALKIARSGHWSLEALGMSCGRVSSWELARVRSPKLRSNQSPWLHKIAGGEFFFKF